MTRSCLWLSVIGIGQFAVTGELGNGNVHECKENVIFSFVADNVQRNAIQSLDYTSSQLVLDTYCSVDVEDALFRLTHLPQNKRSSKQAVRDLTVYPVARSTHSVLQRSRREVGTIEPKRSRIDAISTYDGLRMDQSQFDRTLA